MWVDLGCGAGRATYELALRTDDLVVGVDLSFALLRLSEGARHEGRAVFPMRRVGLVFDRREIAIPNVPRERMSYWCCDVDNLPFPTAHSRGALSLNVLDCVASPLQHVIEMGRVLSARSFGAHVDAVRLERGRDAPGAVAGWPFAAG